MTVKDRDQEMRVDVDATYLSTQPVSVSRGESRMTFINWMD